MCRDYKAGISKMTDIYTVFQVLHTSITYKYYTNTSSDRGKSLAYKIWLVNKGNKIYEDEKTELSNNKSHEQSQ